MPPGPPRVMVVLSLIAAVTLSLLSVETVMELLLMAVTVPE